MICWWKFNCAQQLVEGDQTRENIWSPRKQLHDTMLRILARLRLVMVTRMLSNDCVERGYYLSVLTSPSTQIWPSLPASLPHQQQANDHKLFRTTLKNDWEKASIENIKYFHEKIFHWKCWKWKENILQRNLRLQCWTNTDNIAGFRFPPWGWTMAGPWLDHGWGLFCQLWPLPTLMSNLLRLTFSHWAEYPWNLASSTTVTCLDT